MPTTLTVGRIYYMSKENYYKKILNDLNNGLSHEWLSGKRLQINFYDCEPNIYDVNREAFLKYVQTLFY